ncbi:hypothetical protein MRB53_003348 [Persea americana]|uniref:Uncharacterized protein n=1 Tax=Persea americana TaxID=3435 RepID=A0ACC2MXE6_PERAE|nr:hypothetical protein MRB53_003348 [Persea americana]
MLIPAVAPHPIHPLQGPTEDQILLLVHLEIDGSGDSDAVGADVGHLRRLLVDAIPAERERRRLGGGDAGAVDLEAGADLAAEMGESEEVGDGVDGARGDADVEEADLEGGRRRGGGAAVGEAVDGRLGIGDLLDRDRRFVEVGEIHGGGVRREEGFSESRGSSAMRTSAAAGGSRVLERH